MRLAVQIYAQVLQPGVKIWATVSCLPIRTEPRDMHKADSHQIMIVRMYAFRDHSSEGVARLDFCETI